MPCVFVPDFTAHCKQLARGQDQVDWTRSAPTLGILIFGLFLCRNIGNVDRIRRSHRGRKELKVQTRSAQASWKIEHFTRWFWTFNAAKYIVLRTLHEIRLPISIDRLGFSNARRCQWITERYIYRSQSVKHASMLTVRDSLSTMSF